MRVVVDEREFAGQAIDLRRAPVDVDGASVAAAVSGGPTAGKDRDAGRSSSPPGDAAGRSSSPPGDAAGRSSPPPGEAAGRASATSDGAAVRVDCPPPGAVHGFVGHVAPDTRVSLRGALAAAARSRGLTAPEEDALRDARAELADCDAPTVDRREARRRAAAAGEEADRLRERVATLRGRLQTLRDLGRDDAADAAAEELSTAATRLSEVETERLAAAQRLDALEGRMREHRDARERRLRLEDRVANLERAARESLAAAVYDRFADAVRRLPGTAAPGDAPGAFAGDPVTGALGVVAVAAVDAPVVLSAPRFDSAITAADRLDAPVVLV